MSEDANIVVSLRHDPQMHLFTLTFTAKRALEVVEWQGRRSELEVFGIERPEGFRESFFGEGAKDFEKFKADMEVINRKQFRWKCNIPLLRGEFRVVQLAAPGSGREHKKGDPIMELVYECKYFFGLRKQRSPIRVPVLR